MCMPQAIAPPFHLGDLQTPAPGGLNGRRLALEQANYQGCTTLGGPTLLPIVDLPFATSQVASTLYWWLNFQKEQDTRLQRSLR